MYTETPAEFETWKQKLIGSGAKWNGAVKSRATIREDGSIEEGKNFHVNRIDLFQERTRPLPQQKKIPQTTITLNPSLHKQPNENQLLLKNKLKRRHKQRRNPLQLNQLNLKKLNNLNQQHNQTLKLSNNRLKRQKPKCNKPLLKFQNPSQPHNLQLLKRLKPLQSQHKQLKQHNRKR